MFLLWSREWLNAQRSCRLCVCALTAIMMTLCHAFWWSFFPKDRGRAIKRFGWFSSYYQLFECSISLPNSSEKKTNRLVVSHVFFQQGPCWLVVSVVNMDKRCPMPPHMTWGLWFPTKRPNCRRQLREQQLRNEAKQRDRLLYDMEGRDYILWARCHDEIL